MHNFLNGAEVAIPQNLGLLAHGKHLGRRDRPQDLGDLQEEPLVGLERGLRPVDDLGEGQPPPVGEEDRNTASLQGLDKAVRPETSPPRNQAKCRIRQQCIVVPPKKKRKKKIKSHERKFKPLKLLDRNLSKFVCIK